MIEWDDEIRVLPPSCLSSGVAKRCLWLRGIHDVAPGVIELHDNTWRVFPREISFADYPTDYIPNEFPTMESAMAACRLIYG